MISKEELRELETEINSVDQDIRRNTLAELVELYRSGKLPLEPQGRQHNMHCHTFFSYNGYDYSPSYIAYLAKKSGWLAAGIIDFDVLDAVEEFREAAELFDLNYGCGIESRVFIRELADCVINSPGEPGIAYHLGLGFDCGFLPPCAKEFAGKLRWQARERTCQIIQKVNSFLAPLAIDFHTEVTPLTPNGNATERHLCRAYREKAEAFYPDARKRVEFWAEKLGIAREEAEALTGNPVKLEAKIRAKTMKRGGVGYVPPAPESFPSLEAFNRFLEACGALPAIAWLNGLSEGEADVDRLLDLHISKGAVLLNIIPDRNCYPDDPTHSERYHAEFDRIIAGCVARDIPVVIGTEMNAPGQKLVDDFDFPLLAKYTALFVDGARILAAHTQFSKLRRGYSSDWAKRELPGRADRNRFYARLGEYLSPVRFERIRNWPESADEILRMIDILENNE